MSILSRGNIFSVSHVRQETWAVLEHTSIGERYQGQCICLTLISCLCSAPRTKTQWLSVPCMLRRPPTMTLLDSGFRARLISVSLNISDVLRPPRFSSRWLANARRRCDDYHTAMRARDLHLWLRHSTVPACAYRDEVVHGPESVQVYEVSPYVYGVYRWRNHRPSYCSCYIAHDPSIISHYGCANVRQRIKHVFSFACVEIVFSQFFFF